MPEPVHFPLALPGSPGKRHLAQSCPTWLGAVIGVVHLAIYLIEDIRRLGLEVRIKSTRCYDKQHSGVRHVNIG